MAVDRTRTESGRRAWTYFYAMALFISGAAMLFLVLVGASLLLVVRIAEVAYAKLAQFAVRRLYAESARD